MQKGRPGAGARAEHSERFVTVNEANRARLPGALYAYVAMVVIVFLVYTRIRARKRSRTSIRDPLFKAERGVNKVGHDGRLHNRRPTQMGDDRGGEESPVPVRARGDRRMVAMFDVDDTIKSSGNFNLAGLHFGGVDAQYDRGTIYPGVAQFALELSRHDLPPGESVASVAVLTARPREFANPGIAFMLTEKSPPCRVFSQCGEDNGFPGWGIGIDRGMALYGSIAEWPLYHRRGRRKFINFKDLLKGSTHPDVGDCERNCYVLIGDTGDKDEECAQLLLQHFADDVMGAFLHCVNASPDSTEIPIDVYINSRPICYFRTYPGAARKAYLHGLISLEGMLRVCDAAERELGLQRGSRAHEESRAGDLGRDVDLCRVLAEHKNTSSLQPYSSPARNDPSLPGPGFDGADGVPTMPDREGRSEGAVPPPCQLRGRGAATPRSPMSIS